MSESHPTLLIISQWYPPAFKAGGPIRSVYNLVQLLDGQIDYSVITSSFDLDGSSINHTNKHVVECNNGVELKRILKEHNGPVYLNSMFSWRYGILPLFYSKRVFLSPRGMLKKSALRHKSTKKWFYLRLANLLRLYRNTHFIASNTSELEEIKEQINKHEGISILQNVAAEPVSEPLRLDKKTGELRIIHVGRVHKIKNPLFLLNVLKSIDHPVHLTLVGPVEDEKYWQKCQRVISDLKQVGHRIEFHGALPPDQIDHLILKSHFLVSPSLGENFGHAIFGSLALGRPVLISDRSPWQYLHRECAGWDLDLNEEEWTKHLNEMIQLDQSEFNRKCNGALEFARIHSVNDELKDRYTQLFLAAGIT